MNRITLTIKGIEVIKEGNQKQSGEPYTLSRVMGDDDKRYSTFLKGLQIGETYNFLVENKPFRGKNGKMIDSYNLTGFDNGKYEQEMRKPYQNAAPSRPQVTGSGFTEKDRKTLENIETMVKAIYNSEPIINDKGSEPIPF